MLKAGTLKHTRVKFLPANATSIYQPLDQGIIKNLKAYYQCHWLQFMVDHTLNNKDPLKQCNVLWAIRWSMAAWHKVEPQTIDNCFRKTTLFGLIYGPQLRPANYVEPIVNKLQEMTD